jgi:DNA-binding NarL/FixJ family response regulator
MARARVLLADDHQAILEFVTRLLTPDFEIVGTVGDGQAALDGVAALRPDALVLDISMPSMCGIDVARRLLQRPNAPRIVFLTMHRDRDFIAAAERSGASGYVIKQNVGVDLVPALKVAIAGGRTFPELPDEPSWGAASQSAPDVDP